MIKQYSFFFQYEFEIRQRIKIMKLRHLHQRFSIGNFIYKNSYCAVQNYDKFNKSFNSLLFNKLNNNIT